jgi:hypothetical protein
LSAAVHQLGREIVFNGQDEIAESIVEAELKRASKMLARAACELALDPQDADVSATPMSGRCEIVKVTQDKPLRTRLVRERLVSFTA